MNNLKQIREDKKMSVLELSRKTGISERYLRFIEKGERNPSIKTAALIATTLQSTVDKIFLS
ncbi:MAG: helix-turn-helix transcriptional regulator [Hungatella sp.]|nr:helix-turn-helix transcriptional regulator [Hungatella sp.]